MSKVKTSGISKILLITCGTIFALLSGELLLRAFDVDLRLLQRTLYYQSMYPKLHKASPDAQRLYELIPNSAEKVQATHVAEPDYKKLDIAVNELGFRGKSHPRLKRKGIFRIVVFGGSNTFGPTVGDDDTYPAQMEKILDERFPGKVEVWNAGICAYQMSQDVAYAESVIKEFDPDLLVLQDTNQGRRAFFCNTTFKELKELFGKNKELFAENIPPLWRQDVLPSGRALLLLVSAGGKIHHVLVSASVLYRSFCVGLYSCVGTFSYNSPTFPIASRFSYFWGFNGQQVSDRRLDLFIRQHQEKKIIMFFMPDVFQINPDAVKAKDNAGVFVLNVKGKPSEYQDPHPPSYVYAWYARELCDFLTQKGYLPVDSLSPKKPGP